MHCTARIISTGTGERNDKSMGFEKSCLHLNILILVTIIFQAFSFHESTILDLTLCLWGNSSKTLVHHYKWLRFNVYSNSLLVEKTSVGYFEML